VLKCDREKWSLIRPRKRKSDVWNSGTGSRTRRSPALSGSWYESDCKLKAEYVSRYTIPDIDEWCKKCRYIEYQWCLTRNGDLGLRTSLQVHPANSSGRLQVKGSKEKECRFKSTVVMTWNRSYAFLGINSKPVYIYTFHTSLIDIRYCISANITAFSLQFDSYQLSDSAGERRVLVIATMSQPHQLTSDVQRFAAYRSLPMHVLMC
jgi:hypothetical protein